MRGDALRLHARRQSTTPIFLVLTNAPPGNQREDHDQSAKEDAGAENVDAVNHVDETI
jgi:hypothetical protein